MPNPCPPREVLLGYLHGRTSEAETETVENHLRDCLTCQSLMEILSEESDSLMQRIAGVARARMAVCGLGIEPGIPETNVEQYIPQDRSSYRPFGDEQSSTMIRDYRILECIGTGGMGSVYRALHVRLDKQVALKVLKSERMGSPEAISRFAQEMKLLARLEHRHIVRALDAGEHNGLPYFVMEFVGGINLHQLVRRLGPLPVQEACHIACLAASALQYAHDKKVIHRDVKPSNLMLTPDGNIKLLDLGLAQVLEMEGVDALSRADQVLGTLAYMAPEQFAGRDNVSPQSDIFSLGVTLHELLTAQRPSGRIGVLTRASDIQSMRPDVDTALIGLVGDMLAMVPTSRPLSMSAVEARLRAIASPTDLSALVAEYYRWRSRGIPVTSGFARDTEAVAARSTDRQSIPAASGSSKPLVAASTFKRSWPALALLGCFAAMGWLAIALWTGHRASQVQIYPQSVLASQLIELGIVRLENKDTGQVYELTNGNVELPPGTYILHYYKAPIKFEADGTEIEIASATTQTLRIEAQLTEDFQHPVLPAVGAHATYYGKIWLEGWGDRDEDMLYTLYLEVLAEENKPDSPLSRWLQIEITDSAHRYTETAYIKVDVKHWENRKQLKIDEGYIEAQSPDIERFLADRGPASKGRGLVVPFDRQHDLLAEVKDVDLPKNRLRAQDAIALFFAVEDQMPIAAVPIRTARQLLSAQKRNEWLGPAKEAYGTSICYIASSRTKDQAVTDPGYQLARCKSDDLNPFGIVGIDVNMPNLVATCTMKNAGPAQPDIERTERKLKELKQDAETIIAGKEEPTVPESFPIAQYESPEWVKWFAESAFLPETVELQPERSQVVISPAIPNLPRTPDPRTEPAAPAAPSPRSGRFDLAPIPKMPAFTIWQGKISHGSQRSETVISTARMLGTDAIDGKDYRWIEVTSTSAMEGKTDYWEAARLLVDADAYDKSYVLAIKHGWIAYSDRKNVFKIPDSGNLDELLETRLQLQQQPQVDRVNVIDVLSMLFNAKLTPSTPISRLRAQVNGILAGSERKSITVSRDLRIGTLAGECWKSPELFPGLKYSFFRSPQVHFGFASVILDVGTIRINLEVDSNAESLASDFSSSAFGKPTELSELLNRNRDRLPTDPNWRVWSWGESGKTYMAWAEFGGTIKQRTGRDVLLRDKQGNEICIPERSLAKPDLDFLGKGRHWASFKKNQQRVLKEDKGNELKFLLADGSESSHVGAPTSEDDQRWLNALRAAIKRNANSISSKEQWKSFAGYVR